MKNYLLFTLLTFGLLIIGCGSKGGPDLSPEASTKTVKNIPDWYLNTPVNDGYQYAAAEATSQSMQLAVDKARVAAVSNLSQMIKDGALDEDKIKATVKIGIRMLVIISSPLKLLF